MIKIIKNTYIYKNNMLNSKKLTTIPSVFKDLNIKINWNKSR